MSKIKIEIEITGYSQISVFDKKHITRKIKEAIWVTATLYKIAGSDKLRISKFNITTEK